MAVIKAFELSATIRKKIEESNKLAYKQWTDQGADMLKEMINEDLDAGRSPVDGFGKFDGYADSTKKRKKAKGQQTSPVNLSDTGKLRASLTVRAQAKSIAVWFAGARNSELFQIHTVLGASAKQVIRAMLPFFSGESFSKKIKKRLKDLFLSLYKVVK